MNTRILMLLISLGLASHTLFAPINPRKTDDGPIVPQDNISRQIPHRVEALVEGLPYVQWPVISAKPSDSVLASLKNAYVSMEVQDALDVEDEEIDPRFKDASFQEDAFKTMRPIVVKVRQRRTATIANLLLREHLLANIINVAKVGQEGDTVSNIVQEEMIGLGKLIPKTVTRIIDKTIEMGGSKTITKEELTSEFVQEAKDQKVTKPDSEKLSKYFSKIEPLQVKLVSSKNRTELQFGAKVVSKDQFGPENDSQAPDGSWLTAIDAMELDQELRLNQTKQFPKLKKDVFVGVLSYANPDSPQEKELNDWFLNHWAPKELQKKHRGALSLPFLIQCSDKQWISCVLTKDEDEVALLVTDPQNIDRRDEKGVKSVAAIVRSAKLKLIENAKDAAEKSIDASKEASKLFKQVQQQFGPGKSPEKEEEPVNYDAPLAKVPFKDLPTLEQLIGEEGRAGDKIKIPNSIQVRLLQLQRADISTEQAGTKLKNGLLLYGPPGTGKSTVAQVMARIAGLEIVYAGGGDFRTAYQGSGKAKIDALFNEAIKRAKASGRPVVVIIDEIDGMSSKLEPHQSSQEDSRAMKAFITTLDQYMYDPNIFIICTSNYPERMDPAIRRRFNAVKIPLPTYGIRKKVLAYYLAKQGIEVKQDAQEGDLKAITPYIFSRLVSATKGFSGDGIGDMVNNAAFEAKVGLEPEDRIGLGFRFAGLKSFSEKSLVANTAEILTIPLLPFFHLSPETKMAHHLYSHYKKQCKIMNELKHDEAFAQNKYVKFGDDSSWWAKETGLRSLDYAHGAATAAAITGLAGLAWTGLKYYFSPQVEKLLKKKGWYKGKDKEKEKPREKKQRLKENKS